MVSQLEAKFVRVGCSLTKVESHEFGDSPVDGRLIGSLRVDELFDTENSRLCTLQTQQSECVQRAVPQRARVNR